MRIILTLAALALVGCAAPPLGQQVRETCLKNGHALGTPGFDRCFETTYAAAAAMYGAAAATPVRSATVCNSVGNALVCN